MADEQANGNSDRKPDAQPHVDAELWDMVEYLEQGVPLTDDRTGEQPDAEPDAEPNGGSPFWGEYHAKPFAYVDPGRPNNSPDDQYDQPVDREKLSKRSYGPGESQLRWGDPIATERHEWILEELHMWEQSQNHGDRLGPFDGEHLNGAEVFWASCHVLGPVAPESEHGRWETPGNLRARQNLLFHAVSDPDLARRMSLHTLLLQGATLSHARLEGAFLRWCHLEGADLTGAYLAGANLTHVSFDDRTILTGVRLGHLGPRRGILRHRCEQSALLADIHWGGVDLSRVEWDSVRQLGDEQEARRRVYRDFAPGIRAYGCWDAREGNAGNEGNGEDKDKRAYVNVRKNRSLRRQEFEFAARANQQVATQLRTQTLFDAADRFAYRAQVCRREVMRRKHHVVGYLRSLILAAVAGYGYRLVRIVATYAICLLAFAAIYWLLGIHSSTGEPGWQAAWDAFLVSLSAIHGRATFEQLGAWSPAAWTAAVESVVGIIIEGIFVAMVVQRFVGGR